MPRIKKIITGALGVIFIILGIFGLFLPILQGILFLLIGLLLLSVSFPRTRTWIYKFVEKHPKIARILNKAENWVARFIGKNK